VDYGRTKLHPSFKIHHQECKTRREGGDIRVVDFGKLKIIAMVGFYYEEAGEEKVKTSQDSGRESLEKKKLNIH